MACAGDDGDSLPVAASFPQAHGQTLLRLRRQICNLVFAIEITELLCTLSRLARPLLT